MPAVVGDPEMMPLDAARVRPAGREEPEARDQVYAGVPPVAANWVEYAVPAVPEGRDDVVMANGGAATTRERLMDLVWTGELLSLTDAVKVEVPAVVGVLGNGCIHLFQAGAHLFHGSGLFTRSLGENLRRGRNLLGCRGYCG